MYSSYEDNLISLKEKHIKQQEKYTEIIGLINDINSYFKTNIDYNSKLEKLLSFYVLNINNLSLINKNIAKYEFLNMLKIIDKLDFFYLANNIIEFIDSIKTINETDDTIYKFYLNTDKNSNYPSLKLINSYILSSNELELSNEEYNFIIANYFIKNDLSYNINIKFNLNNISAYLSLFDNKIITAENTNLIRYISELNNNNINTYKIMNIAAQINKTLVFKDNSDNNFLKEIDNNKILNLYNKTKYIILNEYLDNTIYTNIEFDISLIKVCNIFKHPKLFKYKHANTKSIRKYYDKTNFDNLEENLQNVLHKINISSSIYLEIFEYIIYYLKTYKLLMVPEETNITLQKLLTEFDFKKMYISLYECINLIVPYGSSIQLLHDMSSDLDICIISNNKDILKNIFDLFTYIKYKYVKKYIIEDNLANNNDQENSEFLIDVEDIHYAKKIPVLSLIYNYKNNSSNNSNNSNNSTIKFKIEITLNNLKGVFNSLIIREYCLLNNKLNDLIMLIKIWSKYYVINGNKHHYLSSFCYTLMVIDFFNQKELIPSFDLIYKKLIEKYDFDYYKFMNISYEKKEKFIITNLKNIEYNKLLMTDKNDKSYLKSNNVNLSLSDLFVEFLFYYYFVFNNDLFTINITSNKINYRSNYINTMDNKKTKYVNVFDIKDPVDNSYNPASYLNINYTQSEKFFNTIKCCLYKIKNNIKIFDA